MVNHKLEQSFIDEVIARNDIVKIIESYIPLKKQGKNYGANCPFHQENTPSFTVNSQKQFFYCFGCKESGNVITFIMQYEKLSFIETIEKLANNTGIAIPKNNINQEYSKTKTLANINDFTANFYEQQLKNHPLAIKYLKNRKITGITAKKFRLGYAKDAWNNLNNSLTTEKFHINDQEQAGVVVIQNPKKYYDRFRNRVMFPIRDHRGQIVGFGGRSLNNQDKPKYLNSPETPLFHKSKVFYGLYESLQQQKDLEHAIIVEGFLDVIQLHQHGITCALATLGTATSVDHLNLIMRYTKKIIFCFDGDLAGKTAAKKAMLTCMENLLDDIEYKFIILPDNSDPDTILLNKGTPYFQQLIDNAINIDDFFLQTMAESLNLNEVPHRSKLIANCIPIIDNIPGKIIQKIILNKLSQLVKIDVSEFATTKETVAAIPPSQPQNKTKSSLIVGICAALLQNPEFIKHITPELVNEINSLPKMQLLQAIILTIQQNPTINTARLIEQWRSTKNEPTILQLASYQLSENKELLQDEFINMLKKLLDSIYSNKIELLMNKCQVSELQDDERISLINLIKLKKGL